MLVYVMKLEVVRVLVIEIKEMAPRMSEEQTEVLL